MKKSKSGLGEGINMFFFLKKKVVVCSVLQKATQFACHQT
jgi:hypothetical protein